MKRLLTFLLALLMTVTMSIRIFANNSYWPAQAVYNSAKAAGDDAALVKAVNMIYDVYKNENSETAHNRMRTPWHEAALAYERMGMYREAGDAYAKANTSAKWLAENTTDPTVKAANLEFMKLYERSMRYFTSEPEVYAATSQSGAAPYFGALNEPVSGTYVGMCDTYLDEAQSAMLIYAGYNRESFSSYEMYLPDTDRTYYYEAAWNVVEENEAALTSISNGSTDDYMISELKYLESYTNAHPNCKILLRFGAEMNCWSPLNACGSDETKIKEFADKYIAAYRRVADAARKYAPSVALIYSPVDYGQWYTTPENFYPGDEYVDFVGMSTYYNLNSADENKVGSKSDIIWGRGIYQDPIHRVAEIVELADEHKKPVIISECGFSYSSDDGVQKEAHAKEKLTEFYTYINMVYPQIKVVNLFNNNFSNNKYRIYQNPILDTGDTVNTGLRVAYESAVIANEAMASTFTGDTLQSYVKLNEFNNTDDKIKLYVYVPYPNPDKNTVTYTLNGTKALQTTQMPYSYEISTSSLKDGINKLSVHITSGKTEVTKNYILCRDGAKVDARLTNMTDITGDEAYAGDIGQAMARGLINGTSATTVSPKANTTRAQLVTILYRSVGSPAVSGDNPFTDLKSDWYKMPVKWANINGIVNGTSANTFAPDNNVTVQDMALILYRYYEEYLGKTPVPGNLNGISDADNTAGYAKVALAWAYTNRLIEARNSDGKMYIYPTAQATRAEVAKALVTLGNLNK